MIELDLDGPKRCVTAARTRQRWEVLLRPEDAIANRFVSRAHSDALEVWLETGVVGLALIGLFVAWLVVRAVAVWRRAPEGSEEIDQSLPRAATIIITLLLAHSLVDYPLRTAAMMAIMAFACALLFDPPAGPVSDDHAKTANRRGWGGGRAKRPATPVVPASAAAPAADQGWRCGLTWPEAWREPNCARRGPRT
jgi:membrane-associated phospholipid phosphatase